MGEVSGNWTPPTVFAPAAEVKDDLVPATVGVTAPTLSVGTSSNIAANIIVQDTTGRGIISYQYDIAYNPAVLTPDTVPCDVGGTISGAMLPTCNVVTPGLLKVAVFGTVPIAGGGPLMRLRFNVIGAPGTSSPLDVQNFLFNEDPSLLGTVTDGQVNVAVPTASEVIVSGTILDGNGRFVSGATVILTDANGASRSVRSGTFGRFSFSGIRAGEAYTITARAKSMQFPAQVIMVEDSVVGLTIVADQP
jgi:hypothetical protein